MLRLCVGVVCWGCVLGLCVGVVWPEMDWPKMDWPKIGLPKIPEIRMAKKRIGRSRSLPYALPLSREYIVCRIGLGLASRRDAKVAGPEPHCNCCFLKDQIGEDFVVVLVARGRESRMTVLDVVPLRDN